jgi:hypothetical protein
MYRISKMKLLPLAGILLLLAVTAKAQNSFGPKIMAHQTTIQGHKFILNDKVYAEGDMIEGAYGDLTYNIGGFFRRQVSKVFYVHSEALYTSYSSRTQMKRHGETELDGQAGYLTMLTSTLKRLEMPTLLGAKMGSFWVQGGVVSAVPLKAVMHYNFDRMVPSEDGQGANTETTSGEVNEKDWYNGFQLDVQAGLGVTIKQRIMLDFRYQTNLTNMRESIDLLNQSANAGERMSTIGLGLSVNLGKRQKAARL